jgi:hypothetical protein
MNPKGLVANTIGTPAVRRETYSITNH